MNYRRLGRSGLEVSTLTLGTMMFGDRTDEASAGSIWSPSATPPCSTVPIASPSCFWMS